MRPELVTRPDGCPAPVVLEYLAAGDAQDLAVEAHVASCQRCASAIATLDAQAQAFRAANPRERFTAKLAKRSATRGPLQLWWALGLGAAVAGISLMFALSDKPTDDMHLKGAHLSVYGWRPGEAAPRQLKTGNPISSGESIRFRYAPPAPGHLMIVDLDGSNELTVFYPFGDVQSGSVTVGADLTLPDAIMIDAKPGPERIAAIFRTSPFTLQEVRRWLTREPSPHFACPDCVVDWVVLEKP